MLHPQTGHATPLRIFLQLIESLFVFEFIVFNSQIQAGSTKVAANENACVHRHHIVYTLY